MEEDETHEDGDSDSDENSRTNDDEARATRRRRKRDTRVVLTFRDVEESLNMFSGDNESSVRKWIKDFEETSAMCGWSDIQNVIYAKRLLRGSTKLFVNFENCAKTWKILKKKLREEFAPQVNSRQVHKELARRKKNASESYKEYMYKMMEIASQVDIDIESVIQYVIDGIMDDEVNKTVLYGAKDIKDFRSKLTVYENMKRANTKVSVKSKMTDRMNNSDKNYSKTKTVTEVNIKRCFNCGDKDHLSINCPAKNKGTKCFKCGAFGHIAAKCVTDKHESKVSHVIACAEKSSKPVKEVSVNGHEMLALIDSGSDLSIIRWDEFIKIGVPVLRKDGISFRGVGSGHNSTLGSFETSVTMDGQDFSVNVHVVSDSLINHQLILGADFLAQADICLEAGKIVHVRKADSANVCESVPEIFAIDAACNEQSDDVDLFHLDNKEDREAVCKLVEEYHPIKTEEVPVKMKIILQDEIPVYQRPRRLSPEDKREVDRQIRIWLDGGIIKPSTSDFASPIVLVKKRDDTTRICVDYRQVNKKIIKDRYPLPIIEEQLDRLQGAKVFTTLDLENGFFHVDVEGNSQKYTAFVIPDGQFEFLKVPFGLCNSPATFQRYVHVIFRDLMASGILLIYVDDLIIPSNDVKSGIERLKSVLSVASKHGIRFKWSKCRFLQSKIEFLGHVIEEGCIRPSVRKTAAVMGFPEPTNKKSVHSFIGLTSYFRKFIHNYAVIARPLTNLLRDNVNFEFGGLEKRAFHELKTILSNEPVLKLYKVDVETELQTDASKLGFGAVLMQRNDQDGMFHPVYYCSGKTTIAEEKYSSYELEVLAIIKALRKFRIYLIGIKFKIITDCKAFQMTMAKKDLCVRVARWALLLEEFRYTVEHRAGNHLKHVDALSRNPLPEVFLIKDCETGLLARLKNAQKEDNELQKLLSKAEKSEEDGFVIRHGILYREVDGDLLLMVPKSMQNEVIRMAHEQGHFAAKKTEDILRRDYWFKKMHPKIEKVIKNCINCILVERKGGKQEGILHIIDKGDNPLETFHIDHLGPLPTTKKRYQHIFLVVDAFSKFVWIYPTKSTGADEVIDRLKKQAVTFGNPKRIVSDRGAAFTSRAFEEYCTDQGIKHVLIATSVPRGNGQAERINRIIIPLLSKLSLPRPEEWHRYTDTAQQFLNSTPNRSTRFSPFEILIGKYMQLKEDTHVRELIEKEHLEFYHDQRDAVRLAAKKNIENVQRANKTAYDRKRKAPTKYKEGDLVALKRTQFGAGLKLFPKYLGPYRITKALRNDRYMVEKVGQHDGPGNSSASVDHLKAWKAAAWDEHSSEEDEN